MDQAVRAEIEREVRAKARGRVRAKLGFGWHLAVFVLVNVVLYALNRSYTPNTLWFVWPLSGWGLALAFHALGVYQGSGIREEMLEAEVRRELARRGLG
jgi:2TM domain